MKKLSFRSIVIEKNSRYSKDFYLPDYIYNADGTLDREKMIDVVMKEEYGLIDNLGVTVDAKIIEDNVSVCAGKAVNKSFVFKFRKDGKESEVPVELYLPNKRPLATVLVINFERQIPNKYCPIEELMDLGVAVYHLCYKDVTSDDGDFSTGLSRLLVNREKEYSAGKIAVWAYALVEIGKWLRKNGNVYEKLYVAGHSRLGKTALLTAAIDTNFDGVFVNNSGCCGAAISRRKTGETIKKIMEVFPFWFTPSFIKYADNEEQLPFDQHYLTALVAPRKLCISAAELDTWADTDAQFLAAEAASLIYEKLGVVGLSEKERLIDYGESNVGGKICFLKRHGTHYFSRDDWNFYINNIKGE
jgi:hypothetical protein